MKNKTENIIWQWVNLSSRLQDRASNKLTQDGWRNKAERKSDFDHFSSLYNGNYDLGIISQWVDMEPPDLLYIDNLSWTETSGKPMAYFFSRSPVIRAVNLKNELIWEGILLHSDDELLLKLCGKIFIIILNPQTIPQDIIDSAIREL